MVMPSIQARANLDWSTVHEGTGLGNVRNLCGLCWVRAGCVGLICYGRHGNGRLRLVLAIVDGLLATAAAGEE